MARKHFNQFKTTVGATFGPSDAELDLAPGTGSALGTISTDDPIRLTLARGPLGAETEFEIVEFTGRTGDKLTGGSRGLEGTGPGKQWNVGERVENRLTAAEIDEITSGFITGYFESSDITISNSSTGTVSHGLASTPKMVQVLLKCVGANLGYSSGEFVGVSPNSNLFRFSYSLPNSTDISYTQNSGIESTTQIEQKGVGGQATITPGNWRIVLRAIA